jgi:hypothetical protein
MAAPTPSPALPPPPPTSVHTLSGDVFDAQAGPIGDADVNLWIQQERGGYSYWWANGPLRSDGTGHFVAPNVPNAETTILAVKDGYVQPCALSVNLRSDVALHVELISKARFDTTTPGRPLMLPGPEITGTIFETTDAGRQPLGGADLWVENGIEVGLATSRTDPRGAFFLCNLPTDAYLWVTKPGFQEWQGPIGGSGTGPVEIELKRQ